MEITKLMRQAVLTVQRLSPGVCTLAAVLAVFLFAASPAGATYVPNPPNPYGSWNWDNDTDHWVYRAVADLSGPNDLFKIQFDLTRSATVTAETTSYASGNFDPVLWLFNSTTGRQIDKNDDIHPGDLDSGLQVTLGPGSYLFAISSFDQHYCVAGTICNGQVYSTSGWSYNGNFDDRGDKAVLELTFKPLESSCGFQVWPRLSLDHTPPPGTPNAPEPASAWLLLTGGALLALRKFRFAR